jgi:serine/threonine protein kinase/Tfp pilus assembly protein PilF
MPEVGESFQGFKLVDELGRGTFGRVFLATQESLAGRPVALKVTLRPTREPDRLARLQHTNVVPVYSVHAVGQVQLICMPFLGRKTLADALRSHRSVARSPSAWSRKATRAQRGSSTVTGNGRRPATTTPAPTVPRDEPSPLVRDPDAVLRLLSQLAAGLAHAHGRGILHLDIKPANVLLADTGEPMLLDFNLSLDAAEADRELIGGTVPYMAPEQLLDMRSRGRGTVDARTDLYALGVVAYELLSGEPPFPGSSRSLAAFDRLMEARKNGPPPLRDRNTAVTPAAEAIVRKLLQPDPAQRYQTAADLKEDVDRQLSDRPLRFARDRSVGERVRKWRRRNPRLLVGSLVAGVVLAAAGAGAVAVQAADGRSDAEARLRARDALDRMHTLRLDLTTPDDPVAAAAGAARSQTLLAEYGLPDDPAWRERDAFRRLPADTRDALTANLGELLIILARSRADAAATVDGDAAVRKQNEAAHFARAAADCFAGASPPPALARLGEEHAAGAVGTPTTARDHFLDAAELARAGRHADAAAALEEATILDPGHAAAHYLLGYCRTQLGQPGRAAERFALAAGLMPHDHRPFRQWGWTELSSGHYERAARLFERSRQVPAGASPPELRYWLGVTRLRIGRYEEAKADFTAALNLQVRPVSTLLNRADAREKTGDVDGANTDRRAAFEMTAATTTELVERGQRREAVDRAAALADFRKAADGGSGPSRTEAYRGLLRLALDQGDDAVEALRVADEAIARTPVSAEFHAVRATALARLNRHADARQAVATLSKLNPTANDSFRAAGALARGAKAEETRVVMAWLRRAYLTGVRDVGRYESSQDLAALRETEEFRSFRAAIGELSR